MKAKEQMEEKKKTGKRKEQKVRLEMPAVSQNESFARVFAAAFAARLDPNVEELADIKTAVSEAVTNAVVHAYPQGGGTVYLTLSVRRGDTLILSIRDKGKGIPDLKQAMEPLYTTGGEERSGMGFTIMESFMDKLSVSSRPGRGTTVHMEKRIKGAGQCPRPMRRRLFWKQHRPVPGKQRRNSFAETRAC